MSSNKLRVLDLFSGIGGFSLGLEATGGFETAAFCEQNEYADAVLEKHWPDVMSYEDVTMITKERLEQDEIGQIDVICGGFPCQDISLAGKGAGLSGERSGLWFEYARIIGEVGPRWVIIENVSALRGRGLSVILQNLSEIGYDAEWHCIPASYVGAPHQRDRIWIVAYPQGSERDERQHGECGKAYKKGRIREQVGANCKVMANTSSGSEQPRSAQCDVGRLQKEILRTSKHHTYDWSIEPDICRVAHGVPKRVDRLRCLGNAVVPQILEMIGHAILEAHHART